MCTLQYLQLLLSSKQMHYVFANFTCSLSRKLFCEFHQLLQQYCALTIYVYLYVCRAVWLEKGRILHVSRVQLNIQSLSQLFKQTTLAASAFQSFYESHCRIKSLTLEHLTGKCGNHFHVTYQKSAMSLDTSSCQLLLLKQCFPYC